MTAIVEFIQNNLSVEWATLLISMLPIVELRGGIPFGITMGLGGLLRFFWGGNWKYAPRAFCDLADSADIKSAA